MCAQKEVNVTKINECEYTGLPTLLNVYVYGIHGDQKERSARWRELHQQNIQVVIQAVPLSGLAKERGGGRRALFYQLSTNWGI